MFCAVSLTHLVFGILNLIATTPVPSNFALYVKLGPVLLQVFLENKANGRQLSY